MGSHELEIRQGFQAVFTVGIISNHMGKHIAVGIYPGFRTVVIYLCIGQSLSVRGQDAAADHPVLELVLPGVIGTADHALPLHHLEINHIANQRNKDAYEKITDYGIFPVPGLLSL